MPDGDGENNMFSDVNSVAVAGGYLHSIEFLKSCQLLLLQRELSFYENSPYIHTLSFDSSLKRVALNLATKTVLWLTPANTSA